MFFNINSKKFDQTMRLEGPTGNYELFEKLNEFVLSARPALASENDGCICVGVNLKES